MTAASPGQNGILRVGYNLNNAAMVWQGSEGLAGPGPEMAMAVCTALGLRAEPVPYPNARALVAGVGAAWDIAVLAVDPARRDQIAFSTPFHRITATFLLHDSPQVQSCDAFLETDMQVISALGAAYHNALLGKISPERVIVAQSPLEAKERFLSGEAPALAGIRDGLAAVKRPQDHLAEGAFSEIEQAIGVSLAAGAHLPLINEVIRAMASSRAG